jgi:hypothetical protein
MSELDYGSEENNNETDIKVCLGNLGPIECIGGEWVSDGQMLDNGHEFLHECIIDGFVHVDARASAAHLAHVNPTIPNN